jgi:hypothetical protein
VTRSTKLKIVLSLLIVSMAAAVAHGRAVAYDLKKVADMATPIPGGAGTFGSFGQPSISAGNMAFIGSSSPGADPCGGIYLFNGTTLSLVADRNTAVPGDTGTFNPCFDDPQMSGGNVVFGGAEGFYLSDGTTLRRVVDLRTPVPNGSGTFVTLGVFSASGNNVVFNGLDPQGIYLFDATTSALKRVADLHTRVPGGRGRFTGVGTPFIAGGKVAFFGYRDRLHPGTYGSSNAQLGIYLFNGTTLSRIADRTTQIPGGVGTFIDLGIAGMSGGKNVLFYGLGSGQRGLYLFHKRTLLRVADLKTPIPQGSGNFMNFEILAPWSLPVVSPALSGANVAFRGFGSGGQEGIYLFDGIAPSRVADLNTAIPDGVGTFMSISFPAVGEGGVAFHGRGSGGQQGIYLFDGATLSRVVDRNTPIPGDSGTFTGFGPPVISGAKVAFNGFGKCCDENWDYLQQGIYVAVPTSAH